MLSFLQRWSRIALINLLIVAFIGVILRYKIAFSLPFIDQRNLLDAHYHFAFSGWITQALMVLLVGYLAKNKHPEIYKKYQWILFANLITAFGILICFAIQGYAFFSLLFSMLSIIASYFFIVMYWKDLNGIAVKKISHYWFKAALVFNLLSSFGPFVLTFLMASNNLHQNWYLISMYVYLHFQYNGWFFFACTGLITGKIFSTDSISPNQYLSFWLFALACVPIYLLSTLWMHLPTWIYIIVLLAVFAQTTGWILILKLLKPYLSKIRETFSSIALRLIILSAIALSIKLLLQLGSTIPSLNALVYGFRPIVIGYLHLIFLGVVTLFILGYMITEKYIIITKKTAAAIYIFIFGVIINEILLMIQGITALNYVLVPYINEILLAATCIILAGILLLVLFNKKTQNR